MKRWTLKSLIVATFCATVCAAQSLPVKWEELTAPDFVKALDQAKGVCVLTAGIIEKHGPTGPLGTDSLNGRYATVLAAQQEYAIVFPEFFVGQIFEAQHQPGTISYSSRMQYDMLEESTAEMARNGCKKIVLVSAHGGNRFLLPYFVQAQLEKPKDYIIYLINGEQNAQVPEAAKPSGPGVDGHGGEGEMSNVMAHSPNLVHPERAPQQSGADLKRLDLPSTVYTAIYWYASFPNHYQGDALKANAARGAAATKLRVDSLVTALRAIKSDQAGPRLQKQFFEESRHPIDTKQ